jgi:Ribonuclease G/E
MKKHNSNYTHTCLTIKSVSNGFVVDGHTLGGQMVFLTFRDAADHIARTLGLLDVGEELIIDNIDGDEE